MWEDLASCNEREVEYYIFRTEEWEKSVHKAKFV